METSSFLGTENDLDAFFSLIAHYQNNCFTQGLRPTFILGSFVLGNKFFPH